MEKSLFCLRDLISVHRDTNLFDTIVDIDKFVKNLTIKRHYFSIYTGASTQSISAPLDPISANDEFSCREHCAIRDLEEFTVESGMGGCSQIGSI